MLTRRENVLSPFSQLRQEVDRLFEQVLGETPGGWRPWPLTLRAHPPVNLWDDEETVLLEAEVPGLKAEEIDLTVVGDELTLRGTPREIDEPRDAPYLCRERQRAPFSRAIRLPCDVDPGEVEASLHDGVLTVRLPKSSVSRTRRIEVHAQPA